jgi:hypothetical protein
MQDDWFQTRAIVAHQTFVGDCRRCRAASVRLSNFGHSAEV